MADNGMIRLGLISDGGAFPEAPHNSDVYLVYPGGEYGRNVTKLASAGRLVTKPMPDGTIGFGMFAYHGPSLALSKVLGAAGTPEVPELPVVAYLKGKFYVMEKSVALELSGILEMTV